MEQCVVNETYVNEFEAQGRIANISDYGIGQKRVLLYRNGNYRKNTAEKSEAFLNVVCSINEAEGLEKGQKVKITGLVYPASVLTTKGRVFRMMYVAKKIEKPQSILNEKFGIEGGSAYDSDYAHIIAKGEILEIAKSSDNRHETLKVKIAEHMSIYVSRYVSGVTLTKGDKIAFVCDILTKKKEDKYLTNFNVLDVRLIEHGEDYVKPDDIHYVSEKKKTGGEINREIEMNAKHEEIDFDVNDDLLDNIPS